MSVFDNNLRKKPKKYFFEHLEENKQVSMESIYNVYLFEGLIGNDDWFVKSKPLDSHFGDDVPPEIRAKKMPELWNVKMLKYSDEHWVAFPYDFNLSNTIFGQSGGWINVVKIKTLNEQGTLKKQIEEFLNKKQLLLDEIETIKDIKKGEFGTAFYDVLKASIEAFYKNLEKLKSDLN